MLISTSHKTKIAVNLEALMVYPLANHPLELCVPGGAPRKCVNVYDGVLKDLYLTDGKLVPGKETLHEYFLDALALMQVLPRNNVTGRDFAWRIFKSIPQQYSTIFLACDWYKDKSIKM